MPKWMSSAEAQAGQRTLCDELRSRHPRFFYESFSIGPSGSALKIQFHFRFESGAEFVPETTIEGLDPERLKSLPRALLESFVFHIGLVEMLSYWKAACSPEIVVKAGALDAGQIAWWMDLLEHGMGEFFYVNRIRYHAGFVRLTSENRGVIRSSSCPPEAGSGQFPVPANTSPRMLVLTSGGKDSVVTLETLRAAGHEFDCLLLNPAGAAFAVARQAGCEAPKLIHRMIDPRLLELNAAGYLNGHTPFSALLAFLGVTVAAMCGSARVVVSNERSAEEAAAEFFGRDVNHQYSKSFRFETLFRDYSQKYLSPSIEYFSLLRPLYELQIARLFAGYPQYFPVFKSCNRNLRENSWCGRCPKCLFVYTALYPFVDRTSMLAIFGSDLFAWDGAEALLLRLLGVEMDKPFECVGTKEETLAAIYLCIQKYRREKADLPMSLHEIESRVIANRPDLAGLPRRVLSAWTDHHHLPADLAKLLRAKL